MTLITLADPNHQTVRVDDNGSAVGAFATIPVKAGVIDHFDIGINNRTNPTPADVLDPIPGSPGRLPAAQRDRRGARRLRQPRRTTTPTT